MKFLLSSDEIRTVLRFQGSTRFMLPPTRWFLANQLKLRKNRTVVRSERREETNKKEGWDARLDLVLSNCSTDWERALLTLREVASSGEEWEQAMDAIQRKGLLNETLIEATRSRWEVEKERNSKSMADMYLLLLRHLVSRWEMEQATPSMRLLDRMLRSHPKEAARMMRVSFGLEDVMDGTRLEDADVFRLASQLNRVGRVSEVEGSRETPRISPEQFVSEVQHLLDTLSADKKDTVAAQKTRKILLAARAIAETEGYL